MSETKRPLRIAHLSFSALPATVGGVQVVVDNLIRNQIAAGHKVSLVTRWRQYRALQDVGVPYPALPLPPNPRLSTRRFWYVGPRWPVAAAVAWHQWRHRFDVWHIHWVYPTGWMAHDTLSRLGVPTVLTAHGPDLQTEPSTGYGFRQRPKHDRRVRALVPRARFLTAISESIEAAYRELGAAQERVIRIPNGVDTRWFDSRPTDAAAIRRDLNVPRDARLVLSVGRNDPNKGLQFVPETLARLVQQGLKVIWVVVGKDSDGLRKLAEEHGVAAQMRLLPPMRDGSGEWPEFPPAELVDLYKTADLFAFPSLMESFGLVALEAMAAGTPVVGNAVPGIRDVVSDNVDGVLSRPGDPGSMAEAIATLLADPERYGRLVENARAKALAHDWSKIAGLYVDIYREAIGEVRQ